MPLRGTASGSPPRRALALAGPARCTRAVPTAELSQIHYVDAARRTGTARGRLPGFRLSHSRPPPQGRLRRRYAIGCAEPWPGTRSYGILRLRKDGPDRNVGSGCRQTLAVRCPVPSRAATRVCVSGPDSIGPHGWRSGRTGAAACRAAAGCAAAAGSRCRAQASARSMGR